MKEYHEFIRSKQQKTDMAGFSPLFLPDSLFDFQRHLVEWSTLKGRAALFADCGMGKTLMQLVWAENVVRRTNRPVLILTPLAVGAQTVDEAAKFGMEAMRCRNGKQPDGAKIVVTNYQQLHHFDRHDFAGVVCDESSCIKDSGSKTRDQVTEFMREMPYRLLCTATAAPNDYVELGTSSEALGELGFADMVTRFFKKETKKDFLGWGRLSYRLRGHASKDFWRWICSWARACRRPSDLGFLDDNFHLPELVTSEHEVKPSRPSPGRLFDVPAQNLEEQREEQRRTLPERCSKVAELLSHKNPAVAWCYLNDEGDELERMIPDAKQVSGSDSDEEKEETFQAFASGQLRVLIIKPKIGAWGLNWQHCNHMTFFPSHSFEQYYQGVRRCWRFGQKKPVKVDIISTEGGAKVLASLQQKAAAADMMFAELVANMTQSMMIEIQPYGKLKGDVPQWLSTIKS